MTRTGATLLLAAAALAAGCAATPELTGAAGGRSRGATVAPAGEDPAPPAPGEAPAKPTRPANPWMDESRILAKVNGQVITLRQVMHRIGPGYEQFLDQLDDLAVLVNKHVRDLVIRRLVIDEGNRLGKKIGLNVTDEEMDRDEERKEKDARKRGSTVEQMIRDFGMTRREWDQDRRDDILFIRTRYYMTGFFPDADYPEEVFRPCVDSYVSPLDVRTWGERNSAAIDLPASVSLRVLCVSASDFAADGVPLAEALRRCGEALDAFEARRVAGEPFGKLADEGYRFPGAGEGGLVGPVLRDSPFPDQYKEWAFAPERKPGDVSERMQRGKIIVVLYLEKRQEAVHPDIEEWGARERAFLENRRHALAWDEVQIRLLEEGTVSPPSIRDSLLEELRGEARNLRRALEPVDPPRTGADPAR